ncbi:hypothetical protein [Paenibacillus terrigena]|nr:hypothetical protein [Paenibacillus terrigena]
MQLINKLLEIFNDQMDMLDMLKVTYLPQRIYLDSNLRKQHNQLIHFNRC